jgi:hypothetical protein
MKKIIFLLIITFLIFWCSKTPKKEVWAIKEAGQIINDYGETLKWSVDDARAAKEAMDASQQKLQDNLKNIY